MKGGTERCSLQWGSKSLSTTRFSKRKQRLQRYTCNSVDGGIKRRREVKVVIQFGGLREESRTSLEGLDSTLQKVDALLMREVNEMPDLSPETQADNKTFLEGGLALRFWDYESSQNFVKLSDRKHSLRE